MQSDKMTQNGMTPTSKKTAVKAAPKKATTAKKAVSKATPKKVAKAAKTAKPASTATQKAATGNSKRIKSSGKLNLRFEIFFSTQFGEAMLISGAHPALGAESTDQAPLMEYIDDQKWAVQLEIDKSSIKNGQLKYTYLVRYADGTLALSAPYQLDIPPAVTSITIRDAWNAPGFVENIFGTDALQAIQAGDLQSAQKPTSSRKKYTHRFIITAPVLEAGKAVCLIGEDASLGGWEAAKALLMNNEEAGRWRIDISLALKPTTSGIAYKYGIYDLATGQLESFESGDNRILESDPSNASLLILQNGFIRTN
ncbi:carbohydrate-binding module family 20 domain-containing protein [Arachidicoccus terrestris]|uniref:carbohydrate-binding module family 20 domain-containing protein n=1 Tax=Arachidicoccus terrestris TaxID=2875539 RepID=UPI001CC801BE|nr:carbohydrate-binding module family 20 domain-containing protein [Arachidicoccus terrestris]UAY55107.1 hypothetical protein K9M52_17020 [Arachidicoccus terrestris]